jgi:hypothetical protein
MCTELNDDARNPPSRTLDAIRCARAPPTADSGRQLHHYSISIAISFFVAISRHQSRGIGCLVSNFARREREAETNARHPQELRIIDAASQIPSCPIFSSIKSIKMDTDGPASILEPREGFSSLSDRWRGAGSVVLYPIPGGTSSTTSYQ